MQRTVVQASCAEEEDRELEDDLEEDEALEPRKERRRCVRQERVLLGGEDDCGREVRQRGATAAR